MSRLKVLALVAVTMAVASAIHARERPQQPVFRARADAVTVNVAVTRGRAPVGGLSAADFTLRDNGVPQKIEVGVLTELPIDVTIVRGSSIDQDQGQLVRSAANVAHIQSLLRPTDRLRVVSFGNTAREDRPMRPALEPLPVDAGRDRGSSLNDALFLALAWPADPDRRHMVVVFTNGFDTWESTIGADRLPDLAARSDAVLNAVLFEPPSANGPMMSMSGAGASAGVSTSESWIGSGAVPLAKWRETAHALNLAVERTGGSSRYLERGTDAFRQILDDFRSSYLITYTPTGVAGQGWHEVSVTVTRAGSFTVRARKGYDGR